VSERARQRFTFYDYVVASLLDRQLEGRPCRVFSSDLRVRVKASGLGTYPDVSVVCGRLELDPDDPKKHTVTNPRVLVEVLSPSTADYDRGEKVSHYQQIPSVEEILLVSHEARRIDVWRRAEGEWMRTTVEGNGVATLSSIACTLALDDVYRDPLV